MQHSLPRVAPKGCSCPDHNHGFTVPAWGQLLAEPPPEAETDPALHEPADLARGWQRPASKAVDDALLADLASALGEASISLLHSHCLSMLPPAVVAVILTH